MIWLIWLTTSWIAELAITSPKIRTEGLTAQMVRLAARSVGVLAIFALIMLIAHEVGVPVLGLVAGAGAGPGAEPCPPCSDVPWRLWSFSRSGQCSSFSLQNRSTRQGGLAGCPIS